MIRPPFFMVGCVRSGTTMLRNILRSIPDLICPEETHYYRWGEPFGTNGFVHHVQNGMVIKKHRSIDGIGDDVFADVLQGAQSRRDLYERYIDAFRRIQGRPQARWFDKSPQNIYGLALLAHDFPEARFVHIVRNPLNVVASLLEGKVISAPNAVAAANYWNEAVSIFNTCRPLIAERCHELRYESLTDNPADEMARLLDFLGEDPKNVTFNFGKIHPERNQYLNMLSSDDTAVVARICGKWGAHYGYDIASGGG